MKVHFIIPGKPTGKARPRMSKKTGKAFTPKSTKMAEYKIKKIYKKEVDRYFEGAVKVSIIAYYQIPKSNTKRVKEQKIKNVIRPFNIKPDADNLAKLVLDSINKIAYKDDTQVVSLNIEKYYAEEPRVEVFIEEIK